MVILRLIRAENPPRLRMSLTKWNYSEIRHNSLYTQYGYGEAPAMGTFGDCISLAEYQGIPDCVRRDEDASSLRMHPSPPH